MKIHILLLAMTACLNACGQSPNSNPSTMEKTEIRQPHAENTEGVEVFIKNFAQYNFDIQDAGIATLPKASLSADNILEIEYAYHSEGENRTGKMQLKKTKTNYFEGDWKTNADNGNVYLGSLYLDFATNGTAKGFYEFGGSDYRITLFLAK